MAPPGSRGPDVNRRTRFAVCSRKRPQPGVRKHPEPASERKACGLPRAVAPRELKGPRAFRVPAAAQTDACSGPAAAPAKPCPRRPALRLPL